MMGKETPIK